MNALIKAYSNRPYRILFFSLLSSIIAVPLFSALHIGRALPVLFALNLVAAILPIASPRARKIMLVILLSVLLLQLSSNWIQLGISLGSAIIGTFVALLTAVSALRFSLQATEVDSEHIYAALSAYLVAGIFLGYFYWILERISPGSFLVGGATTNGNFQIPTAIYFSFVTLATLGYGDIVPASDISRSVAIVEAVAGQLYLAVMVARLISLYVGKNNSAP
jgi:Ion channel